MNVEKVYEEASKKACESVEEVRGIALGLHSVADGLVVTDTGKLSKLLEEFGVKEPGDLPESIRTPEDFLKGYLFTFSTGKALQMMIDEESVKEWIEEEFGKGKLRLGGTSANMAVALASFGFPNVLVYVYPLVKELAELFPKMENLKTISPDGRLVHPSEGWSGEKLGALHWIFEVKRGQILRVDGKEIVCPRDNRFIASWNPVNSKLKVADYFRREFLKMAEDYPKFLLAGFHIMRDVYPDGETVEDRMRELVEFVRQMKERKVEVHVEMASVRRKRVRKALVDILLPEVDSMGLNEVELSWLSSDLGNEDPRILEGDVRSVEKALRILKERTGLKRIHFHTLGYYALLKENPEEEVFGLATAALAAAFRAERGNAPSCKDLEEALKHRVSEIEMKVEGDFMVFPIRIVEKPVLTVGLGDTISSIAFALS